MATFLFLVSVIASTLLFLAAAAEEIARVVRQPSERQHTLHEPASSAQAPAASRVSALPRTAASARPLPSEPGDWDRAA